MNQDKPQEKKVYYEIKGVTYTVIRSTVTNSTPLLQNLINLFLNTLDKNKETK